MATGNSATQALMDLADATAERLDQWRTTLVQLGTSPSAGVGESTFLQIELRAAAIVATMAELEHVVRESLLQLFLEVNSSGTLVRDLKHCVRSLAMHSTFDSLLNTKNADTAWSQRSLLTSLEMSSEIASLPLSTTRMPQPPLDGRTIRPAHLFRIWDILGITTDVFPAPRCQTSLVKMALLRNDIAHRNVPIADVFKQPAATAAHIARYVDDLELLVLHVANEIATYAAAQNYRI